MAYERWDIADSGEEAYVSAVLYRHGIRPTVGHGYLGSFEDAHADEKSYEDSDPYHAAHARVHASPTARCTC